MWLRTLYDGLVTRPSRRRATRQHVISRRLSIETLDDRIVPASLSVADATVFEGNDGVRSALVNVNLSAPDTKTVTVKYSTAADTAQAGSDYESVYGQLKLAPGDIRETIAVPVYGDRLGEHNETFFVSLSGANVAKIGDRHGVVGIVDDEPRITIDNLGWDEGFPGTRLFPFVVRLSAASNEVVTVNFATADGTGGPTYGAIVAGNDYTATSGTLTFAPGETTKVIYVEVLGDYTPENDEHFFVNLGGASGNYFIENGQALGWITDDDSDRGGGTEEFGIGP